VVYLRDPVLLAVQLVNSWDPAFDDPERLPDFEALRSFLSRRGAHELAERVRRRHLAEVRTLRGNLRRAFEAPNESQAVNALNAVLRQWPTTPQLVRVGKRWEFVHEGGDPVAALASELALGLLGFIRTKGWKRFGICGADGCVNVYVDRSKNASRKYCSQLCADRMSQAAYRLRQSRAADARRQS
jgi:predicted RNA-binding Zn ribbon-like protein